MTWACAMIDTHTSFFTDELNINGQTSFMQDHLLMLLALAQTVALTVCTTQLASKKL